MFSPFEIATMQQYHVTPPAVTRRLLDYAHLRYILYFVREAIVWVTLWLVLQLGWAARMRDWCERIAGNRLLQVLCYIGLLTCLMFVLRLPFNLYSGFYVEHQFGLSNESLPLFMADLLKARAVEIVTETIAFAIALALISKFPGRWPLVLWCALTPLIAFAIFIYPVVVDPLFNKYTPMPDSPTRQAIERLAARAGLHNPPVFVVDKSRQTSKLNAEVTGLGPSARVVIWDTTLQRMHEDELLAVVGHELGHYALGHIFVGFILAAGGLFFGLQAAGKLQTRFVGWLPARWGVRRITDLAAIPAIMLAGSVLGFFFDPLDSAISREIEHQADAYGLTITGDRAAMARAFVVLAEDNLSDPDPPAFIRFWFFDHPTLRERIDFALGIKR